MTPITVRAMLALLIALQVPGASFFSVTDGQRETYEEGAQRYHTIARAIVDGTKGRPTLARYVASVFFEESTLRLDVHRGDNHHGGPTPHEDRGWAWCLGQRHLGPTSKYGRTLVGVDYAATRRCVTETIAVLRWSIGGCGGLAAARATCVFGRYGGVKYPSKHEGIAARVATFKKTARSFELPERAAKAIKWTSKKD